MHLLTLVVLIKLEYAVLEVVLLVNQMHCYSVFLVGKHLNPKIPMLTADCRLSVASTSGEGKRKRGNDYYNSSSENQALAIGQIHSVSFLMSTAIRVTC